MGAIYGRPATTLPMEQKTINKQQTGAQWEKAAEYFLHKHGLKLLQRNFRSRFGEIDLIMEDDRTVVFVEVRFRKCRQHGSGADSVTFHKQHKISRTALWYLAKNPRRATQVCRFDVISIGSEKTEYTIDWIKNAFDSTVG